MPRRSAAQIRPIEPDARYRNRLVQQLVNKVMSDGKKSLAERIVYDALAIVGERNGEDPVETLEAAIKQLTPVLEVRSRRVGGATYQVPVEVRPDRSQALAIRWLISSSRARSENTMEERLSGELMDASQNRGVAVKRREDTHRMADANKAFSHYRW
jgi:small subunit ribosomal protein S7